MSTKIYVDRYLDTDDVHKFGLYTISLEKGPRHDSQACPPEDECEHEECKPDPVKDDQWNVRIYGEITTVPDSKAGLYPLAVYDDPAEALRCYAETIEIVMYNEGQWSEGLQELAREEMAQAVADAKKIDVGAKAVDRMDEVYQAMEKARAEITGDDR